MTRPAQKGKNLSDYTEESSQVKRIRRLAYLLDNSIPIPGTKRRIGVEAIIGLIPGVGDAVGGAISAYIVAEAYRLGVPRSTLLHMVYNVGVETLVGAIPIVGDVFDATWKANARNVVLLDKYFSSLKTGQLRGKSDLKKD